MMELEELFWRNNESYNAKRISSGHIFTQYWAKIVPLIPSVL